MAVERQEHRVQSLKALFQAEPDRLGRLTFEVAGIYFDWSKTHLDQALLGGPGAGRCDQG